MMRRRERCTPSTQKIKLQVKACLRAGVNKCLNTVGETVVSTGPQWSIALATKSLRKRRTCNIDERFRRLRVGHSVSGEELWG
jgi:hypothetical protein